jgi:hypothetical protein
VWQAHLRGQLLLMLLEGVLTGLGSGRCSLRRAAALGLLAAPDGDGEPLFARCAHRRGGADEADEHQHRAQQLAQV